VGGTINLATSDFASQTGILVNIGGGDFNTRKISVAVGSGIVDNTYAIYGRFSKIHTDGYRRNAWSDLWSYHLSFARYDEALATRVNIFGGPERTHLSYEGVNSQELTADRQANKFTYPNETDNFNQPHYQLINEWQISPDMLATNTLYYIKGDGYYEQFKSAKKLADYGLSPFQISDSLVYPRSFYDRDANGNLKVSINGKVTVKRTDLVRQKALDLRDFGWIPSVEWKHEDGILQVGGELRMNSGRHFGTLLWLAAPPQSTQPGSLYYDYWGYRNSYAFFVREQYRITPDLGVLGSIQYQATGYGIRDDAFAHHNYRLGYSFLMPRAGVKYSLTSATNLFANFSQVKREPALNDVHNEGVPLFRMMVPGVKYEGPLLEPETLNDYELGMDYTAKWGNVKINAYWMDFCNELVFGGQINGVGEPILGNAEQSVHRGIELTATVLPMRGLTLSGNLTASKNTFIKYTEHTYDVDIGGNYVSYVRDGNHIAGFPDIIANARVHYEMEWFSATLSMQHVGQQYIDNSENERQNPSARNAQGYVDKIVNAYSVASFSIHCELPDVVGLRKVVLSLYVNNVFNATYEYAGHIGYDDGAPRWFPAATRSCFASLRMDL
jgi:iron complex outermembrane receptor protein